MKYNQKKKKENIEIFLFIMVMAVFAAVLGVMSLGEKMQPVNQIRKISSGWYYYDNGKRTEVTLPDTIQAEKGEELILYNDGITDRDAGKVVTTRGAQYDLKIWLGDRPIYEYQDTTFVRNTQMKSKLECVGEIPTDMQNEPLKLVYSNPHHGKYVLTSVYIGTGSAVIALHLQNSGIVIGIALCFLVLSVISLLITVYLKYRQMPDARFRDVALFLMICAVWLITDSSAIQTYSSHPDMLCTISFYMFMLHSVPMLHFAQKIGGLKKERILDAGIAMFYLNAFIQGLLAYFGVFTFADMLFVTHVLLITWVLIVAVLLWKEYRKKPDRSVQIILIAYMILLFSGLLSLSLYWLFEISYYGAIFEFGILVFLVMIIADTVISLVGKVRYRTEMQAYERLMKEDWMTGMQSREPFENLLAEIPKTMNEHKDILLVFMDIDYLRRINNDFGRAAGDEVIVAAARCIENVFGAIGKCYRTGGDEFAVVVFDPEEDRNTLSEKLDKEIRRYNRNSRYRLSISRGFSSIRDDRGMLKTTGEWKYEADTNMYQNKMKESGALSVICAGITVAMMIAVLGNLGSGGFFCFDSNGVFQKGTGYVFLYFYALVYIVLIMLRMIRSREDYTPEKMSIAGEFLVIEGVCIGVELYTGYIFLSGFGLALGLIFLYLMMNNPGDYIDSTTGAFDKRYFDNWIQEKFTKGIEFHVIAVELFMLKQINKVYGSSTGDLLLVQIARELQNITGSVQVFRTTGNCFLIITDSLTEYEKNRQEIENYFKEPFETDGEKITFPAIICGIINGEKMEKEDVLLAYIEYLISLVKRADETVVIQSDDRILEGFRYEKEVEHFLKTAVDKDLFEVYYQPVFWTKEDRYITLEALSRLKHPCMGMIPPDVFIGIAERQGLIAQIGLLQFRRVCRFIKENEYMMKQIKNVKFNLSPSELLKPGHSQLLIDIVKEYELSPKYFQFEITETVATEYSESFCKAVEDFTNAGIGLCLDDFGSGYANLNAVLRLPFDVVKMDRSLLTGITCDEQAAVFYHSIVTVMQNMGYTIVAEGAETEEEVSLLREWGVDMVQGYYFSRPLPEAELLRLFML